MEECVLRELFFVNLSMSLEERKARLVGIILNAEEEDLIDLLEEDVTHYEQQRTKDAVDDLTPEEQAELKELMEEPAEKDTISYEEFKAELVQWRKSSV